MNNLHRKNYFLQVLIIYFIILVTQKLIWISVIFSIFSKKVTLLAATSRGWQGHMTWRELSLPVLTVRQLLSGYPARNTVTKNLAVKGLMLTIKVEYFKNCLSNIWIMITGAIQIPPEKGQILQYLFELWCHKRTLKYTSKEIIKHLSSYFQLKSDFWCVEKMLKFFTVYLYLPLITWPVMWRLAF